MPWPTLGQMFKAAAAKLLHDPVQNTVVLKSSSVLNALTQSVFPFSAIKAAVHSGPEKHAVSYAETTCSTFGSPYEKTI